MRNLLLSLCTVVMLSACGSELEEGLPIDAAQEKIEKAKDKIKAETKALEDAIKELDEAFEKVNK